MTDLEKRAINTIRFLSIDAIQKANSGHPGLPMGAAPMAYILWKEFLKHNPKNPGWVDRDRFVPGGEAPEQPETFQQFHRHAGVAGEMEE